MVVVVVVGGAVVVVVVVVVCCCRSRSMDGQMDLTKLTDAICFFAKALKN